MSEYSPALENNSQKKTPSKEFRNHFISGKPLQILGTRTSDWAIALGKAGEHFDITVTKRDFVEQSHFLRMAHHVHLILPW